MYIYILLLYFKHNGMSCTKIGIVPLCKSACCHISTRISVLMLAYLYAKKFYFYTKKFASCLSQESNVINRLFL